MGDSLQAAIRRHVYRRRGGVIVWKERFLTATRNDWRGDRTPAVKGNPHESRSYRRRPGRVQRLDSRTRERRRDFTGRWQYIRRARREHDTHDAPIDGSRLRSVRQHDGHNWDMPALLIRSFLHRAEPAPALMCPGEEVP